MTISEYREEIMNEIGHFGFQMMQAKQYEKAGGYRQMMYWYSIAVETWQAIINYFNDMEELMNDKIKNAEAKND